MFRYFLNETKQPFSHVSQQISHFLIECGHDGYQKNPLSMEISKNSSYHGDKMQIEKVTGQNV
jgi:hypothetical protein